MARSGFDARNWTHKSAQSSDTRCTGISIRIVRVFLWFVAVGFVPHQESRGTGGKRAWKQKRNYRQKTQHRSLTVFLAPGRSDGVSEGAIDREAGMEALPGRLMVHRRTPSFRRLRERLSARLQACEQHPWRASQGKIIMLVRVSSRDLRVAPSWSAVFVGSKNTSAKRGVVR